MAIEDISSPTSNGGNIGKFCPIVRKDCIFFDEMQAEGITTREVFYAFDTKAGALGEMVREKWVKPIVQSEGLELYYFPETTESGTHYICRNICRHIWESAFVIADVGLRKSLPEEKVVTNPNVALEIGLAFGFQKNVIFITWYENSAKSISNLAGIDFCLFPSDFHRDGKFEQTVHDLATKVLCFDKVKIYREEDEWDEVIAKAEISIMGDRLLFSRNLSRLTRPRDVYEAHYRQMYPYEPDKVRQAMEGRDKRIQEFERQIAHIHFYDIYDKADVERYVEEGEEGRLSYTLSLEELRRHIDEFKRIVSFPNYHVGLYGESIPFNYVIKGDMVVLMGRQFVPTRLGSIQGVLFSSREVVKEFQKQFRESWGKIRPEDRDKDRIVQWLENLLKRRKSE